MIKGPLPSENDVTHTVATIPSKTRLAICVTVYNETRDQLEHTLDGLIKGLHRFKDKGIDFYEIVVIVIFDGIDKMCVDKSNEKSMLKLFSKYDSEYDLAQDKSNRPMYLLQEKKTMKYKYKEYARNVAMSKRDVN